MKVDLRIEFLTALTQLPKNLLANEIVKNLRKHNLFEYKSPEESMTFKDFVRLIGLCYSYYYQNAAGISDISEEIAATLISTSYPRELIAKLKEKGYTIVNVNDGIYIVTAQDILVPV
jgi:hypothetical protein